MAGDESGALIGRKLGNYRVDSVLGRGGMSVMYKATDVRLGRKVALKVIGESLGADAEFRERFVDEARNTSAIDHANIVPVYDFGELDGMLYIAMRLVDGSDLASRIGGAPMEPERAMALLEQVADALDTLHEQGLVHLDMKPANVLVTGKESAREHVYLADFGLTRRGATGHRTRGGDFLGSPTYAAPEHLRGEPLDGRTDQYALACVAYACLTGKPPYQGEVSAVIKGHLNGQPPSVSRVAGIPGTVDEALHKGMAKSPDERYSSCAGMVSAVRDALRSTRGQHVGAAVGGNQQGAAAHSMDGARGMTQGQAQPQQPGPYGGQQGPDLPQGPGMPPRGQQPPPWPQGQPPQGQPPQGPPRGAGPAGGGYPVQGQPPGPGVPRQPPPGYPPPSGDPTLPGPGGGGGGSKTPWILGAVAVALVVAGTILVIVLVGDDGGDTGGGNEPPVSGQESAPNIPVGPSGSQDQPSRSGQSESRETPPSSIPIEPGD